MIRIEPVRCLRDCYGKSDSLEFEIGLFDEQNVEVNDSTQVSCVLYELHEETTLSSDNILSLLSSNEDIVSSTEHEILKGRSGKLRIPIQCSSPFFCVRLFSKSNDNMKGCWIGPINIVEEEADGGEKIEQNPLFELYRTFEGEDGMILVMLERFGDSIGFPFFFFFRISF